MMKCCVCGKRTSRVILNPVSDAWNSKLAMHRKCEVSVVFIGGEV